MTPSLPSWLEAEFNTLLEAPSGGWDEQLEALCQRAPTHASLLRQLLVIARTKSPPPAEPGDVDGVPRLVGPYHILSRIGQGGMGAVFAAERRAPVYLRVALKVIKLGMDSRAMLGRFAAEREALARMSHPNIAQVLDAGVTEHGQPYFVMELVRGVRIDEYCDKKKLSVRRRVELFLQVCHGVQHAHHKGIIHRDLKPANVLVEDQEDKPVAKIIDFGLARAIAGRLTDQTLFTEPGQLVGTPEFMSPEQAEMAATDIDTRTDVYSLGVMLYVLLVGGLPLQRTTTLEEFKHSLLHTDPPRPSTRLAERDDSKIITKNRSTEHATLRRALRGELDWVTMKALEKDRARRYQTPSELANDLQRFLEGEQVQARPPSTSYRLRRLVTRYRAQTMSVAAVLVSLLVGLLVSLRYYVRADAAVRDYEQLADGSRLERLKASALTGAELPARRAELEGWLASAETILANLPSHQRALATLREQALLGGNDSQPWRFADDRLQFRHDALSSLVERLHSFGEPGGERTLVAKSLAWVKQVEAVTIERHRHKWDRAAQELAQDPRFQTFAHPLRPQLGLIPLGRNTTSGLQEFGFARSGDIPPRGSDDKLALSERFAMVFILLPGGSCLVGAATDDNLAAGNERPQHQVALQPFFLSKYEVTQAQWIELWTGHNPSKYTPDAARNLDLRHPVECVSWNDVMAVLRLHGLDLPSENEWEYGARGGTTTPWWTGADRQSLFANGRAMVNIADQAGKLNGASDADLWPEYDDGFVVHCAAGSMPPNPFGLCEILGNVQELCADTYALYAGSDLVASAAEVGQCVVRGGSYGRHAGIARVSSRLSIARNVVYENVGFRPARRVD